MKDGIEMMCIGFLGLMLAMCGQETASLYLLFGYMVWMVIK